MSSSEATITIFPVGNGDMTLVKLATGRTVLVDVKIRATADDPDDDTPDVVTMLRDRLQCDPEKRLYVDAFLLTHPDKDHCTGLIKHFHLGPPADWNKSDDKIFIREVLSSPLVFRRASRTHVLCEDALAFNAEARRRVRRFREVAQQVGDGDRIQILGEDEDGKTDDLRAILIKVDEEITCVNGSYDGTFKARLLAPHPKSEQDEEEELRAKNQSSVILNFSLTGGGKADAGRFMSGGDAEVAIWERMWQRHSWHPDWLRYDLLQTPHHCSWHSLSYNSWGDYGEAAKVNEDARKALSQTRPGAVLVATSKPVRDDDSDPPCIRAKREYEAIAKAAGGKFRCVGEEPSELNPGVMEFVVGAEGMRPKTKVLSAPAIVGGGAIGAQPLPHG